MCERAFPLNVAAACAIVANSIFTMAVLALRFGRTDRRMIFRLCRHSPTMASGTFSKISFRYRSARAAPVGLSSPVSNSRQKKSDRNESGKCLQEAPSFPMPQRSNCTHSERIVIAQSSRTIDVRHDRATTVRPRVDCLNLVGDSC